MKLRSIVFILLLVAMVMAGCHRAGIQPNDTDSIKFTTSDGSVLDVYLNGTFLGKSSDVPLVIKIEEIERIAGLRLEVKRAIPGGDTIQSPITYNQNQSLFEPAKIYISDHKNVVFSFVQNGKEIDVHVVRAETTLASNVTFTFYLICMPANK